jgi:CHAT domain-containing protein/tetratricopeptide (TPR) repeat protein
MMNLWKLNLWVLVGLLSISAAQAQTDTPDLLLCEADELREAGAYANAYKAYERAYPYYESACDYYHMAYVKTWASEMSYNVPYAHEVSDAAVFKAYSIIEEHLASVRDTLSFYPLTLMNMSLYHSHQKDYEQKLSFCHRAKDTALLINGYRSYDAAAAYNNLGVAYGGRGSWKKALNYLDTSLSISLELDRQADVFYAKNNIAHSYAELGDFERAILVQEEAVEAANEDRNLARALNNLGALYIEVDEWDTGILHLKKALEIRRRLSDTLTDNIFSTQLNLIWAYNESGNNRRSEALLDEVIEEAAALAPSFESSGYLQIACNYKARNELEAGRVAEALAWANKAEQVRSWSAESWAGTKLVKGKILQALGRTEDALWAVQEAYQVLVPGYQPSDYTDIPNWRAMEAIAYTLTLFPLQAVLLEQKASEMADVALQQAALSTLQAADSAVTASRLSYQSPKSKELMSANSKSLYNALIGMHYRLYQKTGDAQHMNRAFLYMEKNKALSVLENLNAMEAARFYDIPERFVEAERSIREDIAFYQLNLNTLSSQASGEQVDLWKKTLNQLTHAQDSLLEIIRVRYPRYFKTRIELAMPGLQTVMEAVVAPDETMIEYFYADQELYVLIADAEKTYFLRLEAVGLEENLQALYDALRNKDDRTGKISYKVYQQVFAPLRSYIKNDKLVIIPDGPLLYIPFDQFLLQPPEPEPLQYLLEVYQTRRLLSGSAAVLYKGVQQEVGVRYGITAMAPLFKGDEQSVRAGDQFGPLPGAQQEVSKLNQLFQGTFLKGADATEEVFKQRCTESGIVHLATHTAINDQFPSATQLLLKGTEKEDGPLHVYEIYGLHIPAQLGFLSGCNTGFGTIKAGEGAISLGHAFAYAGCPNIVMTLWPIKDDLVPDLVRVYYERLSEGLGKAEALREAKIHCLKNDDLFIHPYFWSSFVYSGDLAPVQLSAVVAQDNLWMLFAGLFTLGLLAGIWWYRRRHNTRS